MKTLTICSSANFYKQAADIQTELVKEGIKVLIPSNADKMKASGDYEVEHYKTWLADSKDYHRKAFLMREHFDKVAEGDAVLVLNYEKRGVDNYIGGNVLMEMSLAFYLKKPIYIINDLPEDSPYLEEIIGMEPIILKGDLSKLKKQLAD